LIHSNASPSHGNLNEVIAPNMPHSVKIALVRPEIEDLTDMLEGGCKQEVATCGTGSGTTQAVGEE